MGFPRLTRRKDAEDYKEPQEFLISYSIIFKGPKRKVFKHLIFY